MRWSPRTTPGITSPSPLPGCSRQPESELIKEVVPACEPAAAGRQLWLAAVGAEARAVRIVIGEGVQEARQVGQQLIVGARLHLLPELGVQRTVLHAPILAGVSVE